MYMLAQENNPHPIYGEAFRKALLGLESIDGKMRQFLAYLKENGKLIQPRPKTKEELEAARERAESEHDAALEHGDQQHAETLARHLHALERIVPTEESPAPGIDLFPSLGVTPGCCGLLLPHEGKTVLVAGDAVASEAHLLAGQILPCSDRETAQASFLEAVEIADLIVCGRDGMIPSPGRVPESSGPGHTVPLT